MNFGFAQCDCSLNCAIDFYLYKRGKASSCPERNPPILCSKKGGVPFALKASLYLSRLFFHLKFQKKEKKLKFF